MNLFSWVRLRHYVEIRAFDMHKLEYQLATAALVKGLFYNENSLQALEGLVSNFNKAILNDLFDAVAKHGLEAQVQDINVHDACVELLKIAKRGLQSLKLGEEKYLTPLVGRVERWRLAEVADVIENDQRSYLQKRIIL